MAIKTLTNEDVAALTGEYCYIQRVADGFIMENSAAGGHTLGAFYSAATVTDKKLPLIENASLPGVYEATENRVAFNEGKYVVRYCQSDGTIIAVEKWNVVGDAVTGAIDANVISQANIDFGATQKASITAAVPGVAAIQSGLATAAAQTIIYNAVIAIPAAVWAVAVRTLSGFGTLVADIAAAVWSAATRTLGTGSIAHPFYVTDDDGPVEGAEVWATTDEEGLNRVESGFTDSNGLYTFHLAAGDYYFWAKDPDDYTSSVKETVA